MKTLVYFIYLVLSLIIKICIFSYFQNSLFDKFQELISSLLVMTFFCNSYIIISLILYWVLFHYVNNNIIAKDINQIICLIINILHLILLMSCIMLSNQHFINKNIEFQLICVYLGLEITGLVYIIYEDTYIICNNTSENTYFSNHIINYGTNDV